MKVQDPQRVELKSPQEILRNERHNKLIVSWKAGAERTRQSFGATVAEDRTPRRTNIFLSVAHI